MTQASPPVSSRIPYRCERPQPLRGAAFHGLAGTFVRAVEPHTEADPAALLLQFLVGFGNLIGRGPHFVVGRDEHPPRLFCVVVGESAKARKGSSWSIVRSLLDDVDASWASRVQSGLSSGEGIIHAVRDAVVRREPVREHGRTLRYEDVQADPGIADKRLLVYEPEFASTLRVIERDGNTVSAQVREAWDTGTLRVLTKQSPEQATGAHISLVGHITADELRRYLGRTEIANGFANRFLWPFVSRSKVLPDGGKLDEVDFSSLLAALAAAVRWARELGEHELRRDEEARTRWHEVYEDLSAGQAGLLGAVISRAEAQVMRLALVYALLDRSEAIRLAHLEAGLEVWRYAEDSARFIFGDALGDPVADTILQAVRARPDGLTRTDISRLFTGHKEAAAIGRALTTLLGRGLVVLQREPSGGRPAERYVATLSAKEEKEANKAPDEAGDASVPSLSSLPSPSPLTATAESAP